MLYWLHSWLNWLGEGGWPESLWLWNGTQTHPCRISSTKEWKPVLGFQSGLLFISYLLVALSFFYTAFKEQRNCRSDTTLKKSGLRSSFANTALPPPQNRGGKKRFDPSHGRHLEHEIDRPWFIFCWFCSCSKRGAKNVLFTWISYSKQWGGWALSIKVVRQQQNEHHRRTGLHLVHVLWLFLKSRRFVEILNNTRK